MSVHGFELCNGWLWVLIINMKRSSGVLIFIMGIAVLLRRYIYIVTALWFILIWKPPFVGTGNYIIHRMVVTILVFILKIPLLVRGILHIKIYPPTTNPHRLHGDVLSGECIRSKRPGSRLNIKTVFSQKSKPCCLVHFIQSKTDKIYILVERS